MTNEEQRRMGLLRLERDDLKGRVVYLESLDGAKLAGYIRNYEKLNECLLSTIFILETHLKDFRTAALRGIQEKNPMILENIRHYANLVLSAEHYGRDADPRPLTDEENQQIRDFEEWVDANAKGGK